MPTILIVDDEPALRDSLAETARDLGHEVVVAGGASEGLRLAREVAPDAVLLDLRMPDGDGLEVLTRLRARDPGQSLPVAILTAYATAANTIEAMRLGAFDHLTKPIGREDLRSLLGRMLRVRRQPAQAAAAPPSPNDVLIGRSDSIRAVQKTIGLVADSDATVLVTGETGTGKEVVARTIHNAGARRSGPFIAVNCAAIPAELLESELFGHVRGAFTGAVAERRGAFRDADGGTLFLDEIGDMDLAMQAKILRALQERIVTPVGGRGERVDVRIVAATHRDLSRWVDAGKFRQDLFYRLNVVPIALAPLRERPEDILPLARHFLGQSARPGLHLADDAELLITQHSWSGNVRELRNAIDRVTLMCRSDLVTATDLDFLNARPPVDENADSDLRLPSAIEQLERRMIGEALAACGGNRAAAARRLGIHRQLLHAKAQKYGLGARSRSAREGS